MITFTTALVLLVLGYAVYGAFVERVFGADASRKTPCYTMADGVDYTPMPTWKVYLIQFLNIAGTGPIFGAILGILYGPAAYLWIVFGCIFGGAVHDYLSGMISLRKNGASLPEVVGDELGAGIRLVMRVFSLILMVLVGTVFVTTPAGLLASMTGDWGVWGSALFWSVVIFVYYVLATLLPIDPLIRFIGMRHRSEPPDDSRTDSRQQKHCCKMTVQFPRCCQIQYVQSDRSTCTSYLCGCMVSSCETSKHCK